VLDLVSSRDWLGRTSLKSPTGILCRGGHKTLTQ